MTIKTVTYLPTLMMYAKELGEAKLSKDPERIRKAQEQHDQYQELCLQSDEMLLGANLGDLT